MEEFFWVIVAIVACYGIYSFVQKIKESKEYHERKLEEERVAKKIPVAKEDTNKNSDINLRVQKAGNTKEKRTALIMTIINKIIEEDEKYDLPESKKEEVVQDILDYLVFVPDKKSLDLTIQTYKEYGITNKIFISDKEEFSQYAMSVLTYYCEDFPETVRDVLEEEKMGVSYNQINWEVAKVSFFRILKEVIFSKSESSLAISVNDIKQIILSSLNQSVPNKSQKTINVSACDIFVSHFEEIIAIPVVKKSKMHKPITAAYLFVISDFMLMNQKLSKRQDSAKEIFSSLENGLLSEDDLPAFDQACDLFGQIIRGETQPKGYFCHYDGEFDNTIFNLYLCFGDLIYHNDYLYNYENSPIFIGPIDETFEFSVEMSSRTHKITLDYADKIKNI